MWFIGLILGFLVGSLVGGIGGGFLVGTVGALIGVFVGSQQKNRPQPPSGDRVTQVEWQLAQMQRTLEVVQHRLQHLESIATFGAASEEAQRPDAGARTSEPDVAVPSSAPPPVKTIAADASGAAIGLEHATGPAALSTPVVAASLTTASERAPAPAPDAPAPAKTAPVKKAPPAPAKPNFIEAWLTGGNAMVLVGAVILFIGVGFLVKFAAEHALFPKELRVAMAAAGAIALLVTGWRLRERRSGYALILQGTGIGLLYLTIFGAYRVWQLLPPGLAFALLAVIAALAAVLAVRQDAMALATTGAAGGFLAPILTSTGAGSHIALFSYYALLNAGIFIIAWQKAWRPLNLLGFVFTFVIAWMWGARSYQPELFDTTEPFLILFFLAYVAIAILYALRQAPRLGHYVDGTLIFGVPIVAFGMQAGLVRHFESGLAISSLVLGAFYLTLAKWLHSRRREDLRLLVESFLALGVIFATITIPLQLDARWTSAAWAVEGAGVYWIGLRQQRRLARALGVILQGLAALYFLRGWDRALAEYPLANAQFVGAVLMAAAGMVLHRLMRRGGEQNSEVAAATSPVSSAFEREFAPFLFAWSLAWWLFAGLNDIEHFVPHEYVWTVTIAFLTATMAASSIASLRLKWEEAMWPFVVFLPVVAVISLLALRENGHPFAYFGWAMLPLALGWQMALLRAHEPALPATVQKALHLGILYFAAALGAWEMHWLTREFELRHSAWSAAAIALVPTVLLCLLSSRVATSRWPVQRHRETYFLAGAAPLLTGLWVWSVVVNFGEAGQSEPLPYLPLLNAIDLMHVFIGLVFMQWRSQCLALEEGVDPLGEPAIRVAVGGAAFIWINAILLRTLHHWADIPYDLGPLMNSVLVQTSLSIFWTILALTLMLRGTRRAQRGPWAAGALLMAVVVVKLLVVDLSHTASLMRIVSFIGVGLLMLVIGYVAPVPPAQKIVEEAP